MASGPSYKGQQFSPNKEFTDRDFYIDLLMNTAISYQPSNEYKVIMIYGPGGNGKSYLKDKFIKETSPLKKDKHTLASLDFEGDENKVYRGVVEGLLKIAEELITKGKIPCPVFSLAYIIYFNRTNSSEKDIRNKCEYLFRLNTKLNDNAWSDILQGGIDWLINQKANGAPWIGKLIKNEFNKFMFNSRLSEANKDGILDDIYELPLKGLVDKLPTYLAYDLNKHIEQQSLDAKGPRVTIIFDGFETLWENEINLSVDKDWWVRKFVQESPGIFFLIFGRDRVNWKKYDADFTEIIEFYQLDGLSSEDADAYLEKVPIEEKEIRDSITLSSIIVEDQNTGKNKEGCSPLMLDALVDIYASIKKQNKTPTVADFKFERNSTYKLEEKLEKVFIRLFKHLPNEFSYATQVLSQVNIINENVIDHLVKRSIISPIVSFNVLRAYSFFFLNEKKDGLRMHAAMRKLASNRFYENYSSRYTEVHEEIFDYYDGHLKVFGVTEFDPNIELILTQAIFHKKIYDNSKNYQTWILDTSKKLYGESVAKIVHSALQQILNDLKGTEEILLTIEVCAELVRLHLWNSELAEIEQYVNLGIDLADKYIKDSGKDIEDIAKENPDLVYMKTHLLLDKASFCDDLDLNVEAFELYHAAFDLARKISYYPDKWTYARILVELGRLPEAEGIFYNKLREAIENNDEELKALAYSEISGIFSREEFFEDAAIYLQRSLDLYKKLKGESHKYVWILKERIADNFRREGNIEAARSIAEEVLQWRSEKYGDDDNESGFIHFVLGECMVEQNQIKAGFEKMLHGSNIIRHKIRQQACKIYGYYHKNP